MPLKYLQINCAFVVIKNLFLISIILSSCIVPKKYQKDKPFVIKNTIEVKEGNFTKEERNIIKSRLNAQLDDSSMVNVVDKYFIRHVYNSPPAFDTASAAKSVKNMKALMFHLGYYRATAAFSIDTVNVGKQKRVKVKYLIDAGKPTLISEKKYYFEDAGLQELADKNISKSLLEENKPISKAAVLGEQSRLVDIYRNNGYYKITTEELKVRGDTTLDLLTNISDDPFEQIQQLAEARQKQDSPKIKLAVILNPPADSSLLKRYYINNVYILPDYQYNDSLTNPDLIERVTKELYIIKYHKKLFRSGFLVRNIFLKKGDLYRQSDYIKTINSFSRSNVWKSVNIDIVEVKDSTDKIDLVIQLSPDKQYAFEASLEASYSATSNTNSVTTANAGNLLGLSGNVGLTNRNFWKEGIKMNTSLRAGIELNVKPDTGIKRNYINSNEISISNTAVIPRFIVLSKQLSKSKHIVSPESFSNINLSYINRINLFKLQSSSLALGFNWRNRKNGQFTFIPLNAAFTRLFDQSASFKQTLDSNLFLRYSFNTALVAGSSLKYETTAKNKIYTNRQHTFKINIEESGFPILPLPIPLRSLNLFETYLRQFIKTDIQYTHSQSFKKSAFVFRAFAGIGIASKKDTTLPFFKQYFGGGSNSMRGWPVRGIGLGSKPLAAFSNTRFNDRTGDMQLEANVEYRHNITQIIPNSLFLKGAVFLDVGNIWNVRNTQPTGITDSAQFKFKNLWRDIGINAGYGFRLDFSYFIVRFDFGFRFKRPELSYINNGWKIPALGFDDALKKIFSRGTNQEYRKWRYENFNFTIGINYPF